MRITRELLLNTARDTVKQATYGSHDITCAYLTGSLLFQDPLIGGTTDIDLVYVHALDVPADREIIPVVDEYHLDITHYNESLFSQPRSLRSDVWIGSFLCNSPILLHDTNHWFEFNQAVVAAQFFDPVNAIRRVRQFSEAARAEWMALQSSPNNFSPRALYRYLKSIESAANAIVCISGVPLTERRILLDFARYAAGIQMPGLASGFIDLIVPEDPIEPNWDAWLADWRTTFGSLQRLNQPPLKFSTGRLPYYQSAIEELKDDHQEAALWILISTWSQMMSLLPDDQPTRIAFADFCQVLMLGSDHYHARLDALDAYLDTVEETIERWARQNGV